MSGQAPRRRHSPAVYRRRRLVLLIGLIVVAAVVWLLIAQPWRGAADDTKTPSSQSQDAASDLPIPTDTAPTASGDPSAPAEAEDEDPASSLTPSAPACVADDVTVEALSDMDSYGSGQNPQLSIRLTNNGDADCTMNVGTTTQVFTIMSGDDTWWRSTDCQAEPSDMIVLIAAGQSVTSAAPLEWDRTRSAVGSCEDANRQAAPGGGASYHVAVEIGGIAAAQSKQLLLY